jgi:phosphatidylglycerophosphate synthase
MAAHARKLRGASAWRWTPQRLSILEASLEIAILGGGVAAMAILIPLPLSWRGLIFAALSHASVTILIVVGLARYAPHRHFGLANTITLCRAVFNAFLLAVAGEELLGRHIVEGSIFGWGLTAGAATALILDGVDGWVARRSHTESVFGARFDMETDALFILALSLIISASGIVGPWVLISGLTYYLFRIAAAIWPALMAPLPPSRRRKAICVVQAALLIVALAPPMPALASQLCCLVGLALLIYSFIADTAWLIENRNCNAIRV